MLSLTDCGLVFAGGALGAVTRYGALRLSTRLSLHASSGLFIVNGVGCLLAGAVVATLAGGDVLGLSATAAQALLLGGLLGGFTTFSAVALECATTPAADGRRRVLIEAALSVILAAPLARLGMMAVGV